MQEEINFSMLYLLKTSSMVFEVNHKYIQMNTHTKKTSQGSHVHVQ